MIILKLSLEKFSDDDGRAVFGSSAVFGPGNEYAEGFSLMMPRKEWEYLGGPPEITFVASARQLSVGKDDVVEF